MDLREEVAELKEECLANALANGYGSDDSGSDQVWPRHENKQIPDARDNTLRERSGTSILQVKFSYSSAYIQQYSFIFCRKGGRKENPSNANWRSWSTENLERSISTPVCEICHPR